MSFVQLFFTGTTAASAIDLLRSVLTVASSITAYDAAPVNSWVPITSVEYFALSSSLPGATWHGTNETGLRMTSTGNSFNSTLTVAMPSSSLQQVVSAGAYFVGFALRPGTSNTSYTSYPMYGYAHANGTYNSANSATYTSPSTLTTPALSAYNVYFIRKTPTLALSAQGYVAYATKTAAGSLAYLGLGTGTPMPSHYATTGFTANNYAASATNPWNAYTSNLPIFQILSTTTKSW